MSYFCNTSSSHIPSSQIRTSTILSSSSHRIFSLTVFNVKNLQLRNPRHHHVLYDYGFFLYHQRYWASLFQTVQKNFSSCVADFLGVQGKNHCWQYTENCKTKCKQPATHYKLLFGDDMLVKKTMKTIRRIELPHKRPITYKYNLWKSVLLFVIHYKICSSICYSL
jgi:hypothetical protein